MYNPITRLFLLPIFIPISASLSIFPLLTLLLFFPPRSPAWATVWSLRQVSEQSTSPQRALQSSRSRSNSRWISPTRRAQLPPRRMASTLSPSPCSQVRTLLVHTKSLAVYSFSIPTALGKRHGAHWADHPITRRSNLIHIYICAYGQHTGEVQSFVEVTYMLEYFGASRLNPHKHRTCKHWGKCSNINKTWSWCSWCTDRLSAVYKKGN